jgi:putative aldouronate transport system permease protein
MVLSISGILNSGFEQIYMLQNNLNHGASEVIDTYVYKMGLGDMRYSYATAVGLMKSVVAVILLVGANKFSKLLTDKGIF